MNSGYGSGACAPPVQAPRQESVDDLLNHIYNLSDGLAGLSYRMANAVAGPEPSQPTGEAKDSDTSILTRLRKVRTLLQTIDQNSNRARYALGIE